MNRRPEYNQSGQNTCVIVSVCPYCKVVQIPEAVYCGACGAKRVGYDERYAVDSTGVHKLV
eukprot:gnl/Chilomastix_caulleri/1867.p2 GENE.gnl/Chilomastix_caulleri/1867~~gnl/Chilomastix_caulleri/1867.p2  ORF type:complete len:61 (+),score=9.96 gnl/Chilomastix_caulleri/1867:214-396(+)